MLKPKTLPVSVLIFGICAIFASSLSAQEALRNGKIAFARKNFKEALSLFQKAKSERPSDGEAYYYAGLVLERMGNKTSAMTEFRRATELSLSPDMKEKAFWKLVLYYRYVEDWDTLYAVASRFLAFRHNPEVEKLRGQAESNLNPGKRKVQRLLSEGAEAERKGRNTEALAHYTEAARLEPGNVKILWKAADLHRKLNHCAEALRYYHRAIEVDSSSWYSYYQSGVCYYHLQDFAGAIRSFDRADDLNKKPEASFRFYLNTGRGLSHLELEHPREAEEALQSIQEDKVLFAKSAPAATLASMLALLKNDKRSIEPLLKRIETREADRPALPVLRGLRALLSADFARAERELEPLFTSDRKGRGQLEAYTAQMLILIAHQHYLRDRTTEARFALGRLHLLSPLADLQGLVFRLAVSNPLTPFREDQTAVAARYAKDIRIFAAHPKKAADILMGRILYEAGSMNEARPFLEKGKVDPLCLLYLGILRFEDGDLKTARANIKEALRQDPDLKRRIAGKTVLLDLLESPDPEPTPSRETPGGDR